MPVRRELPVAFEHPGGDEELDVAATRPVTERPRASRPRRSFRATRTPLRATRASSPEERRRRARARRPRSPPARAPSLGRGRRAARAAEDARRDPRSPNPARASPRAAGRDPAPPPRPRRHHGRVRRCPNGASHTKLTMGRVRVPLHSGSRLPLVTLPDDTVLLAAPPPLEPLADVAQPSSRPSAIRSPDRRSATSCPRAAARPSSSRCRSCRCRASRRILDATRSRPSWTSSPRVESDPTRSRVLVTAGLGRRPGRRELEGLLRPDRARDFRGRIVVHDCEADDLRPVTVGGRVLRTHPALVDTDLVVTIGAAETAVHGGPTALLDACAPGVIRAARAQSLLEVSGSSGWRLAAQLEARLRESTPVVGLSLVLDHPRVPGLHRGYPWEPDALAKRRALSAAQAPQRPARRAPTGDARAWPAEARRRRRPGRATVGGARGGARPRHGRPQHRRARPRSTPSSSRCRGKGSRCLGSRSTRSRPPRSASGSSCGSGATPRRSSREARSCSYIRSRA